MEEKEVKLLAINTAFKQSDLALSVGGQRFFAQLPSEAKHSENVLKNIDMLLERANVDVMDVDVLAVVVGPGSFTGLRIGTAIAKGLGCANENLKFLNLSSLQLLAYIAVKSNIITSDFCIALDALSNLAFVQKFSRDGTPLEKESLKTMDEVKSLAVPIFTLDLQEYAKLSISAETLLEFAEKKLADGAFVSVENVVPKYLRLSQAEANLKGTNAGE